MGWWLWWMGGEQTLEVADLVGLCSLERQG